LGWAEYDEAQARTNLRRARRRSCLTVLVALLGLACLLASVMGITQSYIGQALAAPPPYPGATVTQRSVGEVCSARVLQTLGVYCYETYYETRDAPEQVVAYYENLSDLRFPTPPRFQAENRFPFGQQRSARYCRTIIGYPACAQISVRALNTGAEVFIQEVGGSQLHAARYVSP
jgi:hypothetical protein